MINLLETQLFFDPIPKYNQKSATKSNIIKFLDKDGGFVSLNANGIEYYLVNVNMINSAQINGTAKPLPKFFIRAFQNNVILNITDRENQLAATSSDSKTFLRSDLGNYVLVTSQFKPVGDMYFDTIDAAVKALGVDFVKEVKSDVDRILAGESVKQVLNKD